MEHYALSLQCSPILSPLSYRSKKYENAIARGNKFHLRFNQTTLCFPQFTTSHHVARSISHANCMINNSFSVPNSKNIEGSGNKILRGINGVSLVLGCILGMFNFSSNMMNSKFNNAYAIDYSKIVIVGGENSFDSLWKTMTAESIESDLKFDSRRDFVDTKKMHALYLRKCGKKDEVVHIVKELKKEYMKSKDDLDIERSVRTSLIELLLIQGDFEEARKLLDNEIDNRVYSKLFFSVSKTKVNLEKKISKLLESYNDDQTENPEKQSIADICFYKAIIHTKLKDKEAAKWWEAFAKTLTK